MATSTRALAEVVQVSPSPAWQQWQQHVPQNTCGMGDTFGLIMSDWQVPANATAGGSDDLVGLLDHFGPDPFPYDTCLAGLGWLARHHRYANGSAVANEYFAILCASPDEYYCCARSLLLLTHDEGPKWDIRICGTVE